MNTPTAVAIDTAFRSGLRRMFAAGRVRVCERETDPQLEIAALMKQADGGPAVLFSNVKGNAMPVIGNLLSCKENCEAAFGLDYRGIRDLVSRALGNPIAPRIVTNAPVHEHVERADIDIRRSLPVLLHTEEDSGCFITAGIVIVKDPETGVYNASYHRLQLIASDRTAIKLDYGSEFLRVRRDSVTLTYPYRNDDRSHPAWALSPSARCSIWSVRVFRSCT